MISMFQIILINSKMFVHVLHIVCTLIWGYLFFIIVCYSEMTWNVYYYVVIAFLLRYPLSRFTHY